MCGSLLVTITKINYGRCLWTNELYDKEHHHHHQQQQQPTNQPVQQANKQPQPIYHSSINHLFLSFLAPFNFFSLFFSCDFWMQELQIPKRSWSLDKQCSKCSECQMWQKPGQRLVPFCWGSWHQNARNRARNPPMWYACAWLAQGQTSHSGRGEGCTHCVLSLVTQHLLFE